MSAIKPVIRELSEAVLTRDGARKDRLHQLTDNMNDHLDDVVRQVRDKDKFDDTVTTRGSNEKTTTWDPDTGRPVSERGQINEDFGGSARGDNATESATSASARTTAAISARTASTATPPMRASCRRQPTSTAARGRRWRTSGPTG